MKLEEAIKHCLDIADGQDKCADISVSEHAKERIRECAADHRQLAEWLTELKELREKVSGGDVLRICQLEEREKEYKRLLKAAVEDNKNVLTENFGDICQFCKHGSNPTAQCCKPHNGSGSWCCENAEWRYADEALTLIGGEEQ